MQIRGHCGEMHALTTVEVKESPNLIPPGMFTSSLSFSNHSLPSHQQSFFAPTNGAPTAQWSEYGKQYPYYCMQQAPYSANQVPSVVESQVSTEPALCELSPMPRLASSPSTSTVPLGENTYIETYELITPVKVDPEPLVQNAVPVPPSLGNTMIRETDPFMPRIIPSEVSSGSGGIKDYAELIGMKPVKEETPETVFHDLMAIKLDKMEIDPSDSHMDLLKDELRKASPKYPTPTISEINLQQLPEQECEGWKTFFECMDQNSNQNIQTLVITEKERIEKKEQERTAAPSISIDERKKWSRFREKNFVCDDCNRMFTLKQNVQHHVYTYHIKGDGVKVRNVQRFKCTKCESVFKSLEKAQRHEKKCLQPTTPKAVFRCTECERVFPSSTLLKEHISIRHLNLKPFECDVCGNTFGRRGGLRRHMLMVHAGKVYNCPYPDCDHPGYKCTKALTAHVRAVHTGVRPFACMLCQRRFVRKNDLRQHELTHNTPNEFTCEHCGQAFKRAMYLTKHARTCYALLEKQGGDVKPLGLKGKAMVKKEKIEKEKSPEYKPKTRTTKAARLARTAPEPEPISRFPRRAKNMVKLRKFVKKTPNEDKKENSAVVTKEQPSPNKLIEAKKEIVEKEEAIDVDKLSEDDDGNIPIVPTAPAFHFSDMSEKEDSDLDEDWE